MSYRPIMDCWLLGRSKTKYYGAYPSGFLERARPMLVGGDQNACILHVCGGMARQYNGKKGGITLSGFGKNDLTLDIDPECKPDILFDARKLHAVDIFNFGRTLDAILIDRPYSYEDAKHYRCGPEVLPDINKLLADCLRLTDGLVGVIDYQWPSCKDAKEVAAIAVGTGRNSRARWFTIWRKTK